MAREIETVERLLNAAKVRFTWVGDRCDDLESWSRNQWAQWRATRRPRLEATEEAPYDSELPGMWEQADLRGGETDDE